MANERKVESWQPLRIKPRVPGLSWYVGQQSEDWLAYLKPGSLVLTINDCQLSQFARNTIGVFAFPKGTVPFGAPNCPLGLPQNQQCALWLHLKTNIFLIATWTTWTVSTVNIELTYWTLNSTKMLCWQWYTCNKCLVLTITTFKMMGVVMG